MAQTQICLYHLKYHTKCKIFVATVKYTTSESASTIVVINGFAITAGSKPSLFASIGKLHPTSFAQKTVMAIVMQTTTDTRTEAYTGGSADIHPVPPAMEFIIVPLSKIIILIKFATASVRPQRIETLNSFH